MQAYHWDWETHDSSWKRKCNFKEASKIVRKLKRHFKIPKLKMSYNYGEEIILHGGRKGTASYCTYKITLPKNPSLGLICHEVAHLLAFEKHKAPCHHNKKWKKCCERVNKYARKKNYFDNEIDWEFDKKVVSMFIHPQVRKFFDRF